MPDEFSLFVIVAGLAAFLIGLSKGGLGGAAGALTTPLLALILPVAKVVGLLLPILMLADIFAVALHWQRWNGRIVILLLPGAVIGITIGTYFITRSPAGLLRPALGITVLFFALYKILEKRIIRTTEYRERNWHGLVAGSISGFSSALAHTGGPPVRIYLLIQKVSPATFVATTALYFMIVNWIKVPYYLYAGLFDFELLRSFAWYLPLIPIGAWLGRRLAYRFDQQTFERIIILFLIINAVLLIFF
jgi:uncharacterized membrane protein YfcA